MTIEFTPRLQQILQVMLREDTIISVKKLAEKIHVSKRTVQRELEYIESPLRKYNLVFKSKTGVGVWLEGNVQIKQKLLQQLEQNNELDTSDRNERRKRLVLEMLKDKAPKKLYYYSNLFGVSEATISADLEIVKNWFSTFELTIIRKQGYGVGIEGSEKNYRQAMRTFIDENMGTDMIKEVYEDRNESLMHLFDSKNTKNIYNILNNDILKRTVTCILSLNSKRILNLTESSYNGLVLHITIAINRILKQEIIEHDEQLIHSLQVDEDYTLAVYIIQALEKEFQIRIPHIEIAYICLHIKGSKRQYIELDSESKVLIREQKELIKIVHSMIDAYDIEIAYTLKQDEEFIRGLLAHLQPTFIRLTNTMKIKNPLLEQIQTDYESIYKKCKNVAKVIEELLHCNVPDSEIGFLAIHFGAAVVRLENQKESKRKVYIGIVCASGIGISRLMSSKIKKYFMERVEISSYGINDLTPYILEKTDFFISSISFEQESADILFVSPLLLKYDMQQMEKKIYQYERTPKDKLEETEFAKQLEQVNYLAVQIKSIMKEMVLIKVDSQITFKELLIAISETLSPYYNRQILIQEDIERRERLDSQIFPEFGFALLHARTKGMVRPNFSIALPKDFSLFQNSYFKKIGIVIIMLLPIDEHIKENSQLFGFLSETLIEDYNFLHTISNGKKEAIRELLSKYLKQFFNQYLDKI